MITLGLISIIGLAAYAVQRARGGSSPGTAMAALPLVFALLLTQVSCNGSKRTEFVPSLSEAEGYGVGQAIAEALPGGGTVVVIPPPDLPRIVEDIMAARLRGLSSALQEPTYTVTTADGLDAEEWDHTEPDHISLRRFASCLASHPDAIAIVSFDSFPPDTGQMGLADTPVFMGAVANAETAAAFLRQGAIDAYVGRKPGVDARAKPPSGASLDQLFSARYELATQP